MTFLEQVIVSELLDRGREDVPYLSLIEVYREKLDKERDADRRTELEFFIVVLLGFVEMQKELEAIRLRLSREG